MYVGRHVCGKGEAQTEAVLAADLHDFRGDAGEAAVGGLFAGLLALRKVLMGEAVSAGDRGAADVRGDD